MEKRSIDVTGFDAVSGLDVMKKLNKMEPAAISDSVLNGEEEIVADLGNEKCSETEISLSYTTRKTEDK